MSVEGKNSIIDVDVNFAVKGVLIVNRDPFKEYIKQTEPNKRDKGYAWHTAIGLQAVDGLKTSQYLIDTASRFMFSRKVILERRRYFL